MPEEGSSPTLIILVDIDACEAMCHLASFFVKSYNLQVVSFVTSLHYFEEATRLIAGATQPRQQLLVVVCTKLGELLWADPQRL